MSSHLYESIFSSIYLSIYLSTDLSIYLSVYLYLYLYLYRYLSIYMYLSEPVVATGYGGGEDVKCPASPLPREKRCAPS